MSNFINLVSGREDLAAVVVSPGIEVADVGDVAHIKITASSPGIASKIIASLTSSSSRSCDISVQRIKSLSLKIYRFKIRMFKIVCLFVCLYVFLLTRAQSTLNHQSQMKYC